MSCSPQHWRDVGPFLHPGVRLVLRGVAPGPRGAAGIDAADTPAAARATRERKESLIATKQQLTSYSDRVLFEDACSL